MPVANHSRVRLFARKHTNECNVNAMHICEQRQGRCTNVCGGITYISAQCDGVWAAYVTAASVQIIL